MKKNNDEFNFGKRLATLRKNKGLTQTELGKKIGVSQRVIAYYEGETSYPPAALLPKIAKVLSISIDDLFINKEDPEKSINQKLWRKLRKIEELSPQEQKTILNMIETLTKRKE